MHQYPLKVVDLQGAADALPDLTWTHHEMLDEQLTAPVEKMGERHFSRRPIEDVLLLDLNPGQGAASRRGRRAVGSAPFPRPEAACAQQAIHLVTRFAAASLDLLFRASTSYSKDE